MDFLADLYIHVETTFEIVEQGKMKTVAVNRTEYILTPDAISEFKTIHDSWELDICEKNPYDALIGGILLNNFIIKIYTEHCKQQYPHDFKYLQNSKTLLTNSTTNHKSIFSIWSITKTHFNFGSIKKFTYRLPVSGKTNIDIPLNNKLIHNK